jgi:hypothetical protein
MYKFKNIHIKAKKSTPEQMALYKISLLLYRTLNSTTEGKGLDVRNQIICTGRQSRFNVHKSCNYKIGNNILANKFTYIADKFELDLLNLPYPSFKYKMKIMFLNYENVV